MPFQERHSFHTRKGVQVEIIFTDDLVTKWDFDEVDLHVEVICQALAKAGLL